tara:strand:- start:1470 stop:3353 length:1884 start_codon:yes stop_codon:yes gene_type:complete
MKKIYLSILSVAIVSGLNAQHKKSEGPVARSIEHSEIKPITNNFNQQKTVLWSNTFSNAADWVAGHDATACALDWSIGTVSCAGSYPIDDIVSSTANDGWAMVDSDAYGGANGGSEIEDSWITMASPIDLSAYPNVVVEFETQYRRYNSEQPYVVVGIGDGAGNVTWPDLDPLTDISTMTNVFNPFPGLANSAATTNPQLVQVNVSSALVGLTALQLSDIYIRLHWTGTWGYAWFVDDFAIIEQPQNDVQTTTAYISGENNNGVEYGRTPSNHVDPNYFVGAQVFNFGVQDQTNVILTGDFGSFSNSGSVSLLAASEDTIIETTEALTLSPGLYEGDYTSVSDQETAGAATFSNNVYERNFEISDDVTSNAYIYSQDGVGNHPAGYDDYTSLGTASFTGAEDGLVLATLYHVKQADEVSGLRVLLTSTGNTAGGEIIASIKDTAAFWGEDMTNLFVSSVATVTQAAIDAGYVDVWFDEVLNINAGIYYAAIELYSFGNASDIRVLDDRTVDQPFDASAIYIPADQSYSNGTSICIQMLMGNGWGVGINETSLEGVSVYPNPSEGIVNITNLNNSENTIVVYDVLGQIVMTKVSNTTTTVDLSNQVTGVYLVEVSNNNGTFVERVIIK